MTLVDDYFTIHSLNVMACATRKQKSVWLIGFPSDKIPGIRLPSWAEVLRRYFGLHHE